MKAFHLGCSTDTCPGRVDDTVVAILARGTCQSADLK